MLNANKNAKINGSKYMLLMYQTQIFLPSFLILAKTMMLGKGENTLRDTGLLKEKGLFTGKKRVHFRDCMKE